MNKASNYKFKPGQHVTVLLHGHKYKGQIMERTSSPETFCVFIIGSGIRNLHSSHILPVIEPSSWEDCLWRPKAFIADMNEQQRTLFLIAARNTLKEFAKGGKR